MRIVIKDDYAQASEWLARYVQRRILDFKPTPERPFVLGLPTGSTPLGTYRALVRLVKEKKLSFENVMYVKMDCSLTSRTFNMDEYVGLPVTHDQSYHYFMFTNLFDHIDIKRENIHILNGNAEDLMKECENYEKKIASFGGIELFLGGIGPDGHIAFNEPGSSMTSRTRVKTLAYETIVANSRFFSNNLDKVPRLALTVGIQTIMDAREVVILATGQSKALAVAKCIEEGVNHMWTASVLQMHNKAMFILDEPATDELRVRTVRYFKGLQSVYQELLNDSISENVQKHASVQALNELEDKEN